MKSTKVEGKASYLETYRRKHLETNRLNHAARCANPPAYKIHEKNTTDKLKK